MKGKMNMYTDGVYASVDPSTLPQNMDVEIMLDIGENSNKNMIQKLQQVGGEILPRLNEAGQGMAVKQDAGAVLATKLLEAMGLDSNDFLEDYTTDEFKQKAQQAVQSQTQENQKRKELEDRKLGAEAALAESNVAFTNAQTKNTADDNAKQLAVSIDKHFQEWQDLAIKSVKEGAEMHPRPDFQQILMMAKQLLNEQQQSPQQGGPQ